MAQREWWRGAVIYQVYVPSFADGNGDGLGDLIGLLDHLAYIRDLGVDAIWISPFYPSPMRDAGYDVADYQAVEPAFGTLNDFDRIVAATHSAGMKVIVDQVWSHTSSEHPWFRESRGSRTTSTADWYIWADPRGDGSPPNNWLSVFGGSAWHWEAARRQYYLHHFLPSQPKLNLRHPKVLAEHFATAEFWLARGVDGFRLDAIDFMLHDPSLRDNPPRPNPPLELPWNPFRMQRHDYDMCQPDAERLMERIREFMDRFPAVATIGEISSEPGALDRIAALTSEGRLNMAYTLGVMKSALSAAMMRQALNDVRVLNQTGWACWSFSNHDVERVMSRWNPSGREADAFGRLQLALLLSLPGSVCLYQGEELGLPQARVPRTRLRDPFGLTFYPTFVGRDGSRTPMPWVAGAVSGGFSIAKDLWLPIDPDHMPRSVDRQESDPGSLLHAYRRMLAWRRRHPALAIGDAELLATADPVVAFARRGAGERLVAVFNLSPEPAPLPPTLPPPWWGDDRSDRIASPDATATLLPPYGFAVVAARD